MDADGAEWQSTYDGRGNLLSVTDPMGAVVRCTRSLSAVVETMTDALGGVTAERAPACMRAGAAGIAVMGEVMRAAARPGGVGEAVQALARACDPA